MDMGVARPSAQGQAMMRTARYLVADGLFHREGFAREHGFLDAGMTFDDRAIHGHLVAWNHAQPIAGFHLIERDHVIAARARLAGPWAGRD